ncbi:unnamed protein product [Colias eurytheme]|nr:unnamed protein product [Colias eurytheme]
MTRLAPAERVEGQVNLLGEYPPPVNLRYPVYLMRDELAAAYDVTSDYAGICQIMYAISSSSSDSEHETHLTTSMSRNDMDDNDNGDENNENIPPEEQLNIKSQESRTRRMQDTRNYQISLYGRK